MSEQMLSMMSWKKICSCFGQNLEVIYIPRARQATQPGEIGSLESIHGLLKSLKIRALVITLGTGKTVYK